jgi:hypothetical protein
VQLEQSAIAELQLASTVFEPVELALPGAQLVCTY